MSHEQKLLDLIKTTNERIDLLVKIIDIFRTKINRLENSPLLKGDQINEKENRGCPHGFHFYQLEHSCDYWKTPQPESPQSP